MKQQSLAGQGVFEKYGRKSRRELFLDEMEQVVPWSGLEALVRPHYAKAGNGRQPVGLSIMLRTYFVQQWFNLSDPGVEELLYESPVFRRFVGVDLGIALRRTRRPSAVPSSAGEARSGRADAGGGERASGGQGHQDPDGHDRGCDHHPCAFVDQERQRGTRPGDEANQEGQPVVLRAEGDIGVDAKEGMVHSLVTTSANVADSTVLPDLLHGGERKVWGDGGYQGQTEAIKEAAPKAQDMTCRRTKFKHYVDELQKKKTE